VVTESVVTKRTESDFETYVIRILYMFYKLFDI